MSDISSAKVEPLANSFKYFVKNVPIINTDFTDCNNILNNKTIQIIRKLARNHNYFSKIVRFSLKYFRILKDNHCNICSSVALKSPKEFPSFPKYPILLQTITFTFLPLFSGSLAMTPCCSN